MSLIKDLILEQYDERLESYKKISEIVLNELTNIASNLKIECSVLASRVKNRDSLAKKIDRKGTKYKSIDDLTDIVGSRVVTFYLNDVDKIAAKIISSFEIDWENSIDKRKLYAIDQFGYVSLHYIITIPKKMYFDENHPEINEIKTEIQLRTNLQHTWAAIYHETGYKSDIEVPRDILRQFSRLAGLLELADQEFQKMHDNIVEYRRKMESVVKMGHYDEVELTGDSFKVYVNAGAFADLNNRIASINSMEIEPASLMCFLEIFKIFGFTTLKEVDDMVKKYSDLAYQLASLQFSGTDLDIVVEVVGPFTLCVIYLIENGFGIPSIKQLLDLVYGQRKNNQAHAAKLYGFGETLGLGKELENGK